METLELERLEQLRSLGQLPHAGPSAALSAIVEIAAEVCGTPIALVTLIEEDEQLFKAQVGFDRKGTPRDISFCTHAIEGSDIYEVCDATNDPLFAANPLVVGPDQVRFYAGAPMTLASGHRIGTVCVLDDQPRKLTEQQRQVLKRLAQACVKIFEEAEGHRLQELWVRRTLDGLVDAVISVDAKGTVTYMNEAAKPFLAQGCGPEHLPGPTDVLRIFDIDGNMVVPIADCLSTKRRQTSETGRFLAVPGCTRREIEYSVAPIIDGDQVMTGAVMVMRDVSRERDFELRASVDALTGAHSRYAFETRLTEHLATNRAPGGAVAFFDLDRFKAVNDSLGHGSGDGFLLALSIRVALLVESNEIFARIGGDEFAIFLPHAGPVEVERLGEKLLATIDRFCSSFSDERANVSASIGVAMLDEAELSVGEVLRRADAGCYRAKRAGGARMHVFNHVDQLADSSAGNAGWLNIAHAALRDDELILFGQRIKPIDTTKGDSIEVLLRLEHDGRIVTGGEFLPPVERSFLAPKIDEWVVRNTLEQMAANMAGLDAIEQIHINLSARTIGDRAIADRIVRLIENSGIPGNKLCFEMTETAAITDLAAALRCITTLRSLGCKFALDDFGRGFATFEHLKVLPLDVVKIDRLFVSDLATDPVSRHMVAAIQGVCQHLGIETVAEGVEALETVEHLTRLGINAAQGFLYHHPVPLDTVLKARAHPAAARRLAVRRVTQPVT